MITAHFTLCLVLAGNPGLIVPTADLPMIRVDFQGTTYQADAQGRVVFPTDTLGAQATVWAQNHAVRVLNGMAFNIPYTQNVGLFGQVCVDDENGAFTVLNKFGKAFDALRSRVPTLAPMNFGFPPERRIEVSWFDLFPTALTFTEPSSGTGLPLIHLKEAYDSTVVHEFCHAVHFALLPHAVRDAIKFDYLNWILANLPSPYHWFTRQTSPLVAWVESWGDFCEGRSGTYLGAYFVSESPTFSVASYGDWYEGIVANVLFLDMAQVWGFETSVMSYINSEARSFVQYAAYIQTHPTLSAFYPQLVAKAAARGITVLAGGGGIGGGGDGPPRREN
jgi:hypothetical protein